MGSKAVVRVVVNTVTILLKEELKTILFNTSKDRKKRRFWVRKLKRHRSVASNALPKELTIDIKEEYRNRLRMSEEKFNELLLKVQDCIKKQDTVMRQAISPELKLQVTLRYLAIGDSLSKLASVYQVPKNTISNFLLAVCTAIYDALQNFIKVPQTEDEWKIIQNEYYDRWNLPNCCGAIDAKHIVIRNVSHSVILFACVDANYCFRFFNVDTNEKANDAAIKSSLNTVLDNVNRLNFPKGGLLAADNAFPLRTYILKPFEINTDLSRKQKIFNYRLLRTRQTVENAFGILVSRFGVFERPITVGIAKVDAVIKAALAMHNWLRMSSSERYTPAGFVDTENVNTRCIIPGSWRTQNTRAKGLLNLQVNLGSRNYTSEACNVRDEYAEYFSGKGAVPWQLNMIHDD